MKQSRLPSRKRLTVAPVRPRGLLADVRDLILSARQTVARGVNSTLVLMYWKIGGRIRVDIMKAKRAEYGAEIVSILARLSGFGLRSIFFHLASG